MIDAIRALLNVEAVTSIVGTFTDSLSAEYPRIYYGDIPEDDDTMPVINFVRISNPDMAEGLASRPRYQINCRAKLLSDAEALADVVANALRGYHGTSEGKDILRVLYDDTRNIREDDCWNCPVDVFVMHRR